MEEHTHAVYVLTKNAKSQIVRDIGAERIAGVKRLMKMHRLRDIKRHSHTQFMLLY